MKVAVESDLFKYISDDSRDDFKDTAFLITDSSKRYLNEAKKRGFVHFITPQELSKYLNIDMQIIGITGTNGKTTTAAMIYSLLLDFGYRVGLLGTRGFFINEIKKRDKGLTTPSLFEIYTAINEAKNEGCDYFVMEVSSHAIVQKRIEGLEFALKILTNITSDHLDYHKTLQNYIDTKNSFLNDCDTKKLINKDNTNAKYPFQNTMTYGIESTATFSVKAYSLVDGITAQISYGKEEATFEFALFGKHNLYNALASIGAVKILLDAPLQDIALKFENFGGVLGRMQVVSQKPLIIVDFAHTHDGMEQIFQSFLHRKISVVFGAGGDRDRTKRPKMGYVASKYADKIYITSDNPRSENPLDIIEDIYSGIPNTLRDKLKIVRNENRADSIKCAIENLEHDEILLVLGKGDEKYQIIGEHTIYFDDVEEIQKNIRKNMQ